MILVLGLRFRPSLRGALFRFGSPPRLPLPTPPSHSREFLTQLQRRAGHLEAHQTKRLSILNQSLALCARFLLKGSFGVHEAKIWWHAVTYSDTVEIQLSIIPNRLQLK